MERAAVAPPSRRAGSVCRLSSAHQCGLDDACATGLRSVSEGRSPYSERYALANRPRSQNPQSEGDLGDGRLVLTAQPKQLPSLMQTLDANVPLGREAVAPVKRGPQRSFRHAGSSSQFQGGQRLIGTAQCQVRRGPREATPPIELTACAVVAACEEFPSRLQQVMPTSVHRDRAVRQLRLGFAHRQHTLNQRRESSRHVRRRLQQLRWGAGGELQRRRRWQQQGGGDVDRDPAVTWFAGQAELAPRRDREDLIPVRDLTDGAARVRLVVERPPVAAGRPYSAIVS